MLQGQAIQKLHGDKGLAILLADVINGANIRVIQSGGSLGFHLKTGQGLRILGNRSGQELERDKTMQPRVLSLVHHAHPAAPSFLDNAVVRDGSARSLNKILRWETGKSTKGGGSVNHRDRVCSRGGNEPTVNRFARDRRSS